MEQFINILILILIIVIIFYYLNKLVKKREHMAMYNSRLKKALNNKKSQPQDIISIGGRLFDYFNGYTGVDKFSNIFKGDFDPNKLFNLTFEYQISSDNILSTRGYLNFNADKIEIIQKYIENKGSNIPKFNNKKAKNIIERKSKRMFSKSLENNLNSFNKAPSFPATSIRKLFLVKLNFLAKSLAICLLCFT